MTDPITKANSIIAEMRENNEALLALARQYASECKNCCGLGTISQSYGLGLPSPWDCVACRDIRSVIARATNSEDAK